MTDTMDVRAQQWDQYTIFINKGKVPVDRWRDITYGKIVYNVRPQKDEVNHTRLTMGGDRINIDMDCGTHPVNFLTVKLFFNSIILTPGAKSLGLDLKYSYLHTPMDCPQFLQMKINNFPDDVIDHCDLCEKEDKHDFLFIRVEQGMYGLSHVGIISQSYFKNALRLPLSGVKSSHTYQG